MNMKTEINRELGWSIALSVLMMVAGVLAIIVPQVSGIAVTILVGCLLVFCGVTHMVLAWHMLRSGGFWWEILLGILCIVAGGYLLLYPTVGVVSLTAALAVYLILASVLEFILSFQLRPLPGSGWLLVDGIITLILAIIIFWTWPASSLWVIGTLVGVSIFFSGLARLMISLAARRAAKSLSAGSL